MKRIWLLVLFVCVASPIVKSQGRSPEQCATKASVNVARQVQIARPNIPRHDWPAQLPFSTFLHQSKPYYTQLEAKFAVTNDSLKKIKEITWECTLLHPDTNQEVAKFTLVSKQKIAPHSGAILKKKVAVTLNAFYEKAGSANQPSYGYPDVVQAVQVNKLIEIKYTDGSISRRE
jgi:hypothetical protein